MTDNTEPNLDELLENMVCASHLLEQDGCLYCDEVKLKQTIATKLLEEKIELLTKMLRDNHQKPIPEKYALELLKELRST